MPQRGYLRPVLLLPVIDAVKEAVNEMDAAVKGLAELADVAEQSVRCTVMEEVQKKARVTAAAWEMSMTSGNHSRILCTGASALHERIQ